MSRKLRDEERQLWNSVARTAKPLRAKPLAPLVKPSLEPKSAAPSPPPTPGATIAPFTLGAKARTEVAVPERKTPVRMDHKTFQRMARGKLKPEGRIDLHGMTLADAHPALIGFILHSYAAGRRLVLVITGKGEGPCARGPIPYQRGILRRQVPEWLRQAPLASAILEVRPAAARHGGDGALYVYLRRRR
ncbi:MAG: Smr/MutS family protein [Shimia sp.]